MADPTENPEASPEQLEEYRQLAMQDDAEDPIRRVERVYQIWWHWANFELYIVSPTIAAINPPIIVPPASIPGTSELEPVYNIHDHGFKLCVSKAQDMYSSGMSMCRMHYTIEKMVALLVERLQAGGVSPETEVQVAFGGHELTLRKAFESIINLSYNVVVTNFDPGIWGERYLQSVKRLADLGYGYPPEAPRDNYRQSHTPGAASKHGG
jgi:hypothetical protein